ncbi:hypothetical protein E5288_WYG019902 [Bos mutus]|uniref:Uncharacterized protein n=1 Tax=Bos mutus TaxID=72004 RepID=A0A6B0RQ30_9CETA|nr:hypothetical protein [Bos mutus]
MEEKSKLSSLLEDHGRRALRIHSSSEELVTFRVPETLGGKAAPSMPSVVVERGARNIVGVQYMSMMTLTISGSRLHLSHQQRGTVPFRK